MLSNEIFWENQKGKVSIKNYKLIEFLQKHGFANMKMAKGPCVLVRVQENIVTQAETKDVDKFILSTLKKVGDKDVLEKMTSCLPSYINLRKLDMLTDIPLVQSNDDTNTVWVYFQNMAYKVTKSKIEPITYPLLDHKIWKHNIIQRNYTPMGVSKGQFEQFCHNVSGGNNDRFLSLKTIIGYLLSRYQDPSNPKAIILLDQQIGSNGKANGGTGKSIIAEAIGNMRPMLIINGKKFNPSSQFSNQSINLATDIVHYDDMQRNFSLESIFSMLTSGVTVEEKYKSPYFIAPEDAPKIIISSNSIVHGPGGASDERRRCEFELAPHYSLTHLPIHDFGNTLFTGWDKDEWSNFDAFMLECIQTYLTHGLITPKPINLPKNRLVAKTSPEFVEFMDSHLKINTKLDKREFHEKFKAEIGEEMAIHMFTKMLRAYAEEKSLIYHDQSSGGKYYFWLKDSNPKVEGNQDEEKGDNLQSPE